MIIDMSIGIVLIIACLSFFFLGTLWNKPIVMSAYSTLGQQDEEDDKYSQMEIKLKESLQREEQKDRLIKELQMQITENRID